ncbi:hypothetical protein DM872_14290 [Pseudomonas taiwanensis]|nr:hypothetical protein [Pseudomonas taiwanensis]
MVRQRKALQSNSEIPPKAFGHLLQFGEGTVKRATVASSKVRQGGSVKLTGGFDSLRSLTRAGRVLAGQGPGLLVICSPFFKTSCFTFGAPNA